MRRRLQHSKRLRSISMLPTLLTLGNLLCGFAAVHFVAKYMAGADVFSLGHTRVERWLPTHLAIAGYLLFASMVFDALDGRVARLTRKTSDFGAQLDSLADVVSFGVAPAFLLIGLIGKALTGDVQVSPSSDLISGRIVWIIAAIYACCAALRLARFNVENVHDESSHMAFKGLPSPGAAAVVASLVILHEEVLRRNQDSSFGEILLWAMPLITLAAGLLMVSRVRYAHVTNKYLRGRRPWYMLFYFLLLLAAFIVYPQLVLVMITLVYAASGPVGTVYRYFVPLPAVEGPTPTSDPLDRPAEGRRGEMFKP
jgi:CDP-diacylglycerol---serine O-phosphatidyltransferase